MSPTGLVLPVLLCVSLERRPSAIIKVVESTSPGGGGDYMRTKPRTTVIFATETHRDDPGAVDDGPWERWEEVLSMYEGPSDAF